LTETGFEHEERVNNPNAHGQGLFQTILLNSPHPCGLCAGAAKHKGVRKRPPSIE